MAGLGVATLVALLEGCVAILVGYYPAIWIRDVWFAALGEAVPTATIVSLFSLCLGTCVPSAWFRFAFEGKKPSAKPLAYQETCLKLQTPALCGFLMAVDLAFYGGSLKACAWWLAIYAAVQETIGLVGRRRRRRIWNDQMALAQAASPEASFAQQTLWAKALFNWEMQEKDTSP